MSKAREEILASIRRALGVTGREAPRRAAVTAWLEGAAPGPIPQRVHAGDLSTLFVEGAERARASVAQVADARDVPAAVASYLSTRGLPLAVRIGADVRLSALAWSAVGLEIRTGPSAGGDTCSVSHGFAGVAETGTLVLVSGPENPTTLNFLPDDHIVVINSDDLAPSLESVWARLRVTFGPRRMPRSVNLITGPSRSADIEQTMLLGAHGPRRLHIIIVGRS